MYIVVPTDRKNFAVCVLSVTILVEYNGVVFAQVGCFTELLSVGWKPEFSRIVR